MGTDDDGSILHIIQFLLRAQYDNSFALQIFYYFFVVDDRAVSINRTVTDINLFVYCIYRTFYTETESGGLCFDHFHMDYLQ